MKENKTCSWIVDEYGIWHTDCDKMFVINEGGPIDNGMKYCCYCGKELVEDELLFETREGKRVCKRTYC